MKTSNNQNGVQQHHSLFPQIQLFNSANKGEIGTAEEQTLVKFEIKATKLKRIRKKADAFPDPSFLKSPNLFKQEQKELMISFNCQFSGKDECLITVLQKSCQIECDQFISPLTELIQTLFTLLEPVNDVHTLDSDATFLTRVEKIILKNIDQDDFGPKELSAALKISRGHLHRKIKALSGHTTTDFIHIIRIKLACNLLQKNSLSVKEIAYEIGYKDPCYFTRVFTRLVGQSPTQFSLACVKHRN